jgi:hypothetical protein
LRAEYQQQNRPERDTEQVDHQYSEDDADKNAHDAFDTLAHRLPACYLDDDDGRYWCQRTGFLPKKQCGYLP